MGKHNGIICCLLFISTCSYGFDQNEGNIKKCAYQEGKASVETKILTSPEQLAAFIKKSQYEHQLAEVILIDNGTVQVCNSPGESCYTMWSLENNKTRHILMQGCWSGESVDEMSYACAGYQIITLNQTYFCECNGNLCNANMTEDGTPMPHATNPSATIDIRRVNSKYRNRTIITALVSVFAVAFFICLTFLIYRLYCRSPKPQLKPINLIEAPPTPIFELDQLKMTLLISHGRFGEVWKGTLDDLEVAVKVFSPSQKNCYINEREILMLPMMDHESLPRFYGTEERLTEDGVLQYVVVMSFIPGGTVSEYLKVHTVNWHSLCRMYHSIASGLAHLHTDIIRGDKFKPAIAHRDLNTRNILVQEDQSCCIIDFGFAMKVDHRSNPGNGQEENVEQTSLTDVGTLRYMAPELLEGAVNLRDCEASLKQIDIYSLGLIFWEMGMRCHDLYQGLPAPAYQLPFQSDLGARPTFEQMQYWVARNKKRPAFPEIWKDTNQAMRALKETIEDCWDQDAEARLTAMCVEERTMDMMTLWETRHKGVTPTITSLGELEEKVNVQRNPTSSQFTVDVDDTHNEADLPNYQNDAPALCVLESNERQAQQQQQQQQQQDRRFSYTTDNSVSTSTVETTVVSPSEQDGLLVNLNYPAAHNLLYGRNPNVLKPHQGHNPTVERNTHKGSDEELTIHGNKLVNKNSITPPVTHNSVRAGGMSNAGMLSSEELYSALADNLEGSLVQNDLLNQRGGRIAYLQNPTSGGHSEPLIVRPKQPNIPGNGSCHGGGRSKKNKGQGKTGVLGGRFSLPQFLKRKTKKQPDHVIITVPTYVEDGLGKSNLEPRPNMPTQEVATEVCLLNGAPVVRPTSLALQGGGAERLTETQPGPSWQRGLPAHTDAGSSGGASDMARSDELMESESSSTGGSELSHPSIGSTNTALQMRPNTEALTLPAPSSDSLDSANGNPSWNRKDALHNHMTSEGQENSSNGPETTSAQKPERYSWYTESDDDKVSDFANFSGAPETGTVRSGILLEQMGNGECRTGNRRSAADYMC